MQLRVGHLFAGGAHINACERLQAVQKLHTFLSMTTITRFSSSSVVRIDSKEASNGDVFDKGSCILCKENGVSAEHGSALITMGMLIKVTEFYATADDKQKTAPSSHTGI